MDMGGASLLLEFIIMAIYAWGFGKYGQLGTGESKNCELPQRLKLPAGACPVNVSCGAHFTLVTCKRRARKAGEDPTTSDERTTLYACGWGKYGRLGVGSEENQLVPTEVALPAGASPAEMSAGHWHAACVTTGGELYVWGYNKSLGLSSEKTPIQASIVSELVPRRIPGLESVRFKSVSCGHNFTYAVDAGGVCYSWGSNKHGVLGQGDVKDRLKPSVVDVEGGDLVAQVTSGYSHTAMLTDSGALYTTGSGSCGQLGHAHDRSDKHVPTKVAALVGVDVIDASCSKGEHHSHTMACSRDGLAYAWGDGYKGKLGLGSQESTDVPAVIDPAHFSGERVVRVSCGGIHSAAITDGGGIFTWGCGSDGRLGHAEAKGHRYLFRSDVPRVVERLREEESAEGRLKCVALSCSYYHTTVLCAGEKA